MSWNIDGQKRKKTRTAKFGEMVELKLAYDMVLVP